MLATYDEVLTSETDTVNIDYKNYKLEDDGYYLEVKNSNMFPQILCFAVGIGSAALFIFLIVKEIKGGKDSKIAATAEVENQPQSLTNNCPYCGTTTSSNKHTCPNCGADI